jgi:hypothetical protein
VANPVYITYTTPGAQAPINIDWLAMTFQTSVAVFITANSACSYEIDFTLDDLQNIPTALNPTGQPLRWFADPRLGPGTTTSGFTTYQSPITAIRFNALTLSGSVEVKVIQGVRGR